VVLVTSLWATALPLRIKTQKRKKKESRVLGLQLVFVLIATKFLLHQEEIEGFGAILMTLSLNSISLKKNLIQLVDC